MKVNFIMYVYGPDESMNIFLKEVEIEELPRPDVFIIDGDGEDEIDIRPKHISFNIDNGKYEVRAEALWDTADEESQFISNLNKKGWVEDK